MAYIFLLRNDKLHFQLILNQDESFKGPSEKLLTKFIFHPIQNAQRLICAEFVVMILRVYMQHNLADLMKL